MPEQNRTIRFTYEDYKSMPESETNRYELLDGDMVKLPPPLKRHQEIVRDLGNVLWNII